MRRAALLTAVVLVAAACGNDDDGSDGDLTTTTSTTAAEQPEDEPAEPEPAPEPEPAERPLAEIDLTLTQVAEAEEPTSLVTRPGSPNLYVAERPGRVRQVTVSGSGTERSYEVAAEPLVDISDEVVSPGGSDERGLLDIEFSPDGSRLYLSYSVMPDGDTRIDEFAMDGDAVDGGSRRQVLGVDQPFANHNGGDIEFGPDELMWVGLGDGGGAGDPQGNAQNPGTLLGSLLRIDPGRPQDDRGYGIPADNPFADGGGAPEVWLYGVRNPWRFTFDPATDDLWIADVGQNAWEEIDLLPAPDGQGRGANLGWPVFEGTHEFSGGEASENAIPPIFEYPNPDEGCSVTGGAVYRGEAVEGLAGAYLFGDFCQGLLRALRASGGAVTEERTFDQANAGSLVSFGVDADGEVYALSLDGTIYRIDPAG